MDISKILESLVESFDKNPYFYLVLCVGIGIFLLWIVAGFLMCTHSIGVLKHPPLPRVLDKNEYIPPIRIPLSPDLSTDFRSFTCWKYIRQDRYLAVSNGRLLRILDTQRKSYILTYLHRSKIFRISALTDSKLALLCFIAPLDDSRKQKQIVVDIIQLPLISTERTNITFLRRYESDISEVLKLGATNLPYFITYSNRFVEFGLRNGIAFLIDTVRNQTSHIRIIHDDHLSKKLFPDRYYRQDENLLIYSIGNTIFTFPNFDATRVWNYNPHATNRNISDENLDEEDEDVVFEGGGNSDDVLGDYETWKTNFSPYGSLSCVYLPLREQDSLVPAEVIFSTQYNFMVEMKDRFGDSRIVNYEKNKPATTTSYQLETQAEKEKLLKTLSLEPTNEIPSHVIQKKVEDFPYEEIDHIEKLTIPPGEHNSLLVGMTWGGHVLVLDTRSMTVVERIHLRLNNDENEGGGDEGTKEPVQSPAQTNFEMVVSNGNEIFLSFMNYSDVYCIKSKTLCDTARLESRVTSFSDYSTKNQLNIKHFTRFVGPRGLLIFEFPSSLLYYDIRSKNLGSLKLGGGSSNKEDVYVREVKCSRYLSIPKRKVEKMILGFRCSLTAIEKVDVFLFFWECQMYRRCWALIRQIEFEDQYSLNRMKQMFLLMYAKVERGWYFGVDPETSQRVSHDYPLHRRYGPGKFFRTSLTFKLFLLLFRQNQHQFLKTVLTTSCTEITFEMSKEKVARRRRMDKKKKKRISLGKWVSKVRKEIIDNDSIHQLEEHPDYRVYDTRELPLTNLMCTVDNMKQLFDRESMILDSKKKNKKQKKKNMGRKSIHLDDMHFRNVILKTREGRKEFHVHIEVILTRSIILHEMIMKNEKLKEKVITTQKTKNGTPVLELKEIVKDVDLETILGSCYTRDIRPARLRKKYKSGRTIRGIREGKNREIQGKARLILLAQRYSDNDILVDLQVMYNGCVELLSMIKNRMHEEEIIVSYDKESGVMEYVNNKEFDRTTVAPTKGSRGRRVPVWKYEDKNIDVSLLTFEEMVREKSDFYRILNVQDDAWGVLDPQVNKKFEVVTQQQGTFSATREGREMLEKKRKLEDELAEIEKMRIIVDRIDRRDRVSTEEDDDDSDSDSDFEDESVESTTTIETTEYDVDEDISSFEATSTKRDSVDSKESEDSRSSTSSTDLDEDGSTSSDEGEEKRKKMFLGKTKHSDIRDIESDSSSSLVNGKESDDDDNVSSHGDFEIEDYM